ncbi:hypothetical protein [Pseudomonas segetis]|uniref:Uncharacterized protein n=1 Tax=Pseudomonas segetis TaxID=298908 RepID=A0A239CBN5_9PSED|nr:hypothetical protein [Pseudomonas segetis]SNS16854.1 hypothetical protein SAMN05216255_1584 [Pseudomonas segetis]
MKKLRQGQTVYYIDRKFWMKDAEPELRSIFLYSQKQPMPPPGVIVEKCPVTHARHAQARGFKLYTSRRKALRAMRLIK